MKLRAPLAAVIRSQTAADNQLTSCGQLGWNPECQHGRSLDHEVGGIDHVSQRMLSEPWVGFHLFQESGIALG